MTEPSPPSDPLDQPILTFDPEWLAVTRAFNPYMSTAQKQLQYPDEAEARAAVARELEWVEKHVLGDQGVKRIDECQLFSVTAPGPMPGAKPGHPKPSCQLRLDLFQWIIDTHSVVPAPLSHYPNPQTAAFCAMLGIENKIDR